MKTHIPVPGQPTVMFGVQIIQDDLYLATGMIGDDAVHEVGKLDTAAAPVMAGPDQAGVRFERGEQRGGGACADG